jgi:hypothetical protein
MPPATAKRALKQLAEIVKLHKDDKYAFPYVEKPKEKATTFDDEREEWDEAF